MAILDSGIMFTGSLGKLSAYKMRGVDGIIVRRKGGASKKKIRTSPSFAVTRNLNAEFSGRSTASRHIMNALRPLKALADYNVAGPLNARLKPVQMMDTESEFGQRHIVLSKNAAVLEGFSLNRKRILESVVGAPVSCVINRESLSAEVIIPTLMPGINFEPGIRSSFYSFQAVLGIVPDMFFSSNGYRPSHKYYLELSPAKAESQWYPTQKRSDVTTLRLKLESIPPDDNFALMLSIGIRFGSVIGSDPIQQIKYAGSARIVRLG